MDKLRAMPEKEKFQRVFEMVRLYQKHVLPFVESHLGYQEMHNLRSVWRAAIIPIHGESSEKRKYEQAYSNWLWMARCSHDAMADQLTSPEVLDYKRMLLKLYERQLNYPELALLRLLKAHKSLAKEMLYEMQWLTPIELSTCTNAEVTCIVHNCKIRKIAGTDRVCRVDCQNIGRAYAHRLYHLKRVTTQMDHGCTISLTPFEDQPR